VALPLEGVRVVDLSSVVLGPYASQNLADYGADVIKVEPPEGDSTRDTGPSTEAGMGAIFLGVNRGKRSVVLDLKQARDREALHALVATADVLMHSIRPQKLAAIGLDPGELMARHPRLVYAGLHGFGEDGPYGGKPAYDDIIQGMAGGAALMQLQSGDPRYFPTIAADKTCALVATHAILAALFARERTGRGSYVEVPMFETMASFNLVEHFYGHHFTPPLADCGYPRVLAAHRRPYRTRDGFVCVMPYTDAHWRRFFLECGRQDAADDPRFTGMAERTRNIAALYALAAELLLIRTTQEWLQACERLEIPAARVNGLDELERDPHLQATGFFRTLHDPAMGDLRFPGPPVRIDRQPLPVRMAPRLGEHTDEVLAAIGIERQGKD
jgi:crotonobetainyl-CoA:carnitine CoA-transferase CaiB-like acyl-CoA transferase